MEQVIVRWLCDSGKPEHRCRPTEVLNPPLGTRTRCVGHPVSEIGPRLLGREQWVVSCPSSRKGPQLRICGYGHVEDEGVGGPDANSAGPLWFASLGDAVRRLRVSTGQRGTSGAPTSGQEALLGRCKDASAGLAFTCSHPFSGTSAGSRLGSRASVGPVAAGTRGVSGASAPRTSDPSS